MSKEAKRNDNVKDGNERANKRPKRTIAQKIDSSVWFHTIYGGLDGLTISYSTVKFLCDATAATTDSYHTHLDSLLHNETWLPVVLFETAFLTTLSLIANRAAKKKQLKNIERFCRDYWPYLRDVLRGAKSGYRGIKSLFTVCKELNILHVADLRAIAVPLGLAIGAMGLISRVLNRYIDNQRYALEKRLKTIRAELDEYNELKERQEEARLLKERNKHKETSLDYIFYQKKLEQHPTEKAERLNKHKQLIKEHDALIMEIDVFEKSIKSKVLYVTTLTAALADGPYMYAGVLLLCPLPPPFMIITAIILTTMFVGLIFARLHEEHLKRERFQRTKLEAQLVREKKAYQTACATFLEHLKAQGITGDAETLAAADTFQLKALYDQYNRTTTTLNKLYAPTYLSGMLSGLQDGLSCFGAISSIYFAVGIFLFLSSTPFPPALIIAGAFLGVAAIIGFTMKRIHQTWHDKKEFKQYQTRQKFDNESENKPYLEYIVDCNTDGFTRGEFYFQEAFEVVRCLGSGPYKSNNLTDFMLSSLKEQNSEGEKKESAAMVIFCGATSIVYGLCLAIRAFGKGFSKPKPLPTKEAAQTSSAVTREKKRPESAVTLGRNRHSLFGSFLERPRGVASTTELSLAVQ